MMLDMLLVNNGQIITKIRHLCHQLIHQINSLNGTLSGKSKPNTHLWLLEPVNTSF